LDANGDVDGGTRQNNKKWTENSFACCTFRESRRETYLLAKEEDEWKNSREFTQNLKEDKI